MLVPRSRLLVWVALVTLPLSLLEAVEPGARAICILIAGAFGTAVLADAWGSRRSLAATAIELPPVVRMSKDREGKLEVRIRNEDARRRSIRVALGLPREISADTEEIEAILPAETEWSRLVWTCTPSHRGNYRVDKAYIEGASTLGFWAARRRFSVESEIRVYPNLMKERKNLAAIFVNRGHYGLHSQRQIGKGRDFEKLREYVPGDSFDEIHWKAAARRARPITKVFQIERTQEIYVVIDSSRLSARDADGSSILERLVTSALVLGLVAEQQGDLFGLLTFSDKVETFVRARNGKNHYSVCRDALNTLQARSVTPDFEELCTFIRLRMRRRALIVFLTSLDDPALAESFVRNVELVRLQHLVLVNMIRQPGVQALFTDQKAASIDDLYRNLGGHLQWQKLRRLEKSLYRVGIGFSVVENEQLSAGLISQYLGVKRRQLI